MTASPGSTAPTTPSGARSDAYVQALFIGYLFGVRSERQLVREIEVNVAIAGFCA